MVATRSRKQEELRTFIVQLHPSVHLMPEIQGNTVTVQAVRASTNGGVLRFRNKITDEPVKEFGPGAWVTYVEVVPDPTPDPSVKIPDEVLAKVEKALEEARRFARTFANVNRGVFHDDIKNKATKVYSDSTAALTALEDFLPEPEEDDDDDD